MDTETTRAPVPGATPALEEESSAGPGDESRDRRPLLALVAIVICVASVYAGAAQLVSTPRVHPDEHIYGGAAASLAEGDGLTLRGEPYELGPLYPVILAPILALTGDRETAYALYKVANALLFALAAFPIYLVARRVLRPWWSVGVAAFSIAVPSSMYVALVMTESVSYLVYSIAIWAMVLALERPSTARQLGVLGAVALAYLTRAQFAVVFGAYVLALVAVWAIVPRRPRLGELARSLWPTLAALAAGVAVLLVRPLVTGSSPLDAIGAYQVLFRGYDPLDIVKWSAYHLADLELYLAVVPIAVSPIVLSRLWRTARNGSRPAAAFIATFATINAAMLFVTAAFASTEFGFDRLHDRNVFYLAPLWLIVLGLWLADGLPRPRAATAAGIASALLLLVALPFRYIASDVGVDVVPSALWARLQELLEGEVVTARKLMVLGVLVLLTLVALLPRRLWWVVPSVLLVTFLATGALAWQRIADATENDVFRGAPARSWVDDLLPDGARVTKVYLVTNDCPASALTWHALYLTEFFNRSLERAAFIGDSIPDGLPIRRVDVQPDGALVAARDEPLAAEYVVTQPGIELAGRKLGMGTAANLVLWRTGGPVRVVGASSDAELKTRDCA
jgi:hypothetical protein